MKKIILLFLIFISIPNFAQKKGIPIISDILHYFTTPIDDDSLKFFQLNFFNKRIGKVISGVYFEAGTGNDNLKADLINKIAKYPFYSSSPDYSNTILGGSIIINPFQLNFGMYNGSQNLDEMKLNFALPPATPDANKIINEIKFNNYSASFNYIPFTLFWGYAFPSVGIRYTLGSYTYNYNDFSLKENFNGLGIDAQFTFKFKNLFANISYSKYLINSKYFNDGLYIKGGICF